MNRPVFFVNGFLESGKTSLINFTMKSDSFPKKGDTLLIVCETGIEEYDYILLSKMFTHIINIEKEEDFNVRNLERIVNSYDPDRIIIEYNGMWKTNILIPDDWTIVESVACVNAQTFISYFNNLRQLFVNTLQQAELIIVNRASNKNELQTIKKNLRAINKHAQIVFENEDERIDVTIDCELPYDVSKEKITISNDDFATFYIDALENPDRYEGKTVQFKGMVANYKELEKNQFLVGRLAMTCCENDMSFLGIVFFTTKYDRFDQKTWINITGKMAYEYSNYFKTVGPIIYMDNCELTKEIKGVLNL